MMPKYKVISTFIIFLFLLNITYAEPLATATSEITVPIAVETTVDPVVTTSSSSSGGGGGSGGINCNLERYIKHSYCERYCERYVIKYNCSTKHICCEYYFNKTIEEEPVEVKVPIGLTIVEKVEVEEVVKEEVEAVVEEEQNETTEEVVEEDTSNVIFFIIGGMILLVILSFIYMIKKKGKENEKTEMQTM